MKVATTRYKTKVTHTTSINEKQIYKNTKHYRISTVIRKEIYLVFKPINHIYTHHKGELDHIIVL